MFTGTVTLGSIVIRSLPVSVFTWISLTNAGSQSAISLLQAPPDAA